MKPIFQRFILVAAAGLLGSPPARAFDSIDFLKPPISVEKAGRLTAAAATSERLYVLDEKKSELIIFDSRGQQLKVVAKEGENPFLANPKGIGVGPDGEIFVADTRNSRIRVFDADGKPLRIIGEKGVLPGKLNKPASVAVGADGRVYVADTGNHRVQVFTQEGIFLFGFGGKGSEKGKFSDPTRIEVTLSDHIYVLDAGNDRLQKFNPDTSVAREYKLEGEDFAVDAYGFVYMLDPKRGQVRELGPDGLFVGKFGASGKGVGQFKNPQGLAIDPDGTLIIVDTGNQRLQRVRLTNKLKIQPLEHNLATKLTVTGPSRKLGLSAVTLGSKEKALIGFLEKEQKFVVLDANGKEEVRFNQEGKDAIKSSMGLAASQKYGLYVSDTKGDKISLFAFDGSHKTSFGAKDGFFASTKKEGNVNFPHGIAINEKGTIYVADTGNRRVDAFSPDGAFLFSFGPQVGPHEFSEPVALAWDEAGFIYVVDKGLKKVFKCEPSGGFIKAWGSYGNGVAQFDTPVAIAYDGRSYLYVLDRVARRVMVFDRDGNWVTNFFAGGKDERSLDRPTALTIADDELIISDPEANRIVSFKLHPRLAPPVHVSTKAVEGQVVLSWKAGNDPWIARYRVYRSSSQWGAYAEVAKSKESTASDSQGVEAYQKYYYRVAVESRTGDMGPRSQPVEVFIPGAFNQAPVEISTVAIGNVFSANYKWYLTNSLGRAVVTNNLNLPFKNVKVSFRLKDFMDFATEKIIASLNPKESVEVPLVATLNNRILEVSEDTPIQAEVSLTYFEDGKKQEVSQALPLKVYSRNAITWEDPRRIANYITPKDPPVLDLGREILRQAADGPAGTQYLNENLATALRIWSAMGAVGVKFLPSPNNPFEKMSEDPAFPVDYTQFPRETLRRKSGECDDLVTLLASMFEGATVRAALLDYPGHLALMFDTGSNDTMEIGLPEDRMIEYDGSFWLPLEATMVGSTFEDSTRRALHAYKEMKADGKATITDPRKSWLVYAPATLPVSQDGAIQPEATAVATLFDADAKRYLKDRYDFVRKRLNERVAEEGESVELVNLLGVLEVQHGQSAEAKKQFEKALELEAGNAAALNNLGSLAFVEGKFADARGYYERAVALDPDDAGVWMNLTRTALKLGENAQAAEYSKKAVALNGDLAPSVESLLKR